MSTTFKILIALLLSIAVAGEVRATIFSHTQNVDTASSQILVTGDCTSWYTDANSLAFGLDRVDDYVAHCTIKRNGALQPGGVEYVVYSTGGSPDSWSKTLHISAAKQEGCIYCTRNAGAFRMVNPGGWLYRSTGTGKNCAATEGSGGSGGEN